MDGCPEEAIGSGTADTAAPRPRSRLLRSRERSRGVALVEFAIAFPFLALIVFGVIDGTRALITWLELKNAAREGAVYAQNHPHQWQLDADGEDGGICDDGDTVRDHTLAEGDGPMSITIVYNDDETLSPDWCRLPSPSNPIQPGDEITVQAATPFNAITPFADQFFDNIVARASTRVQG